MTASLDVVPRVGQTWKFLRWASSVSPTGNSLYLLLSEPKSGWFELLDLETGQHFSPIYVGRRPDSSEDYGWYPWEGGSW